MKASELQRGDSLPRHYVILDVTRQRNPQALEDDQELAGFIVARVLHLDGGTAWRSWPEPLEGQWQRGDSQRPSWATQGLASFPASPIPEWPTM